MNDATMQQIWNEFRLQLLNFRASFNTATTDADKAARFQTLAARLEEAAHRIDTNRRTSLYNLPSLYQDQTNALISKAMYLAKKWVADGQPQVPTI